MIEEAKISGAKTIELLDGTSLSGERKISPTIIVEPNLGLKVMNEEIFGPILPVIPYDSVEEAKEFVVSRDHPLALYIFAEKTDDREYWLRETISGGVTINDTLLHVVFDTLPFGGVGSSGNGAYHGDKGFETFSHLKSIMYQSKINFGFLFEPPFTGFKKKFPFLSRKII